MLIYVVSICCGIILLYLLVLMTVVVGCDLRWLQLSELKWLLQLAVGFLELQLRVGFGHIAPFGTRKKL